MGKSISVENKIPDDIWAFEISEYISDKQYFDINYRKIELRKIDIVGSLNKCIRKNFLEKIKCIDFSSCNIGDPKKLKILSHLIEKCENVEKIKMTECEIVKTKYDASNDVSYNKSVIKHIFFLIYNKIKKTKIDRKNQQDGMKNIKKICDIIKGNEKINYLDISYNNMKIEHICYFLHFIEGRKINYLDISGNLIVHKSRNPITTFIKKNKYIKDIILNETGIKDDDLEAIVEARDYNEKQFMRKINICLAGNDFKVEKLMDIRGL